MKHGIVFLSLLMAVVCTPRLSFGQAQGVFVVDVQKVLSNSLAGKAARSNVEAEVKKSEARLAGQRQEVERLRADLGKQQAVLSKEALEQKSQVLKKKQRELELGLADEQDKLRRKNGEEIEKVLVEIRAVLAKFSEEKKYPVIIEKDSRLVVYVNPELDLTDKVIAALDQHTMG